MNLNFLFEENSFESFSSQHYYPLLTVFLLGLISILYARHYLNKQLQKYLLLFISFFPLFAILVSIVLALHNGTFNLQESLPCHICRFLALATPIVIWKENKYWAGVFYFWILVGTLNANITPDVEFGFPHWKYFCYWLLHSFLVIIPLYQIFVLKNKIEWLDFKNAFFMFNLFLLMTLIVNSILGSNYMYTLQKPSVATMLDILGPWPIYLLTGQFLVLFLFFLVYLPFIVYKRF